jgi:hypothetical protein
MREVVRVLGVERGLLRGPAELDLQLREPLVSDRLPAFGLHLIQDRDDPADLRLEHRLGTGDQRFVACGELLREVLGERVDLRERLRLLVVVLGDRGEASAQALPSGWIDGLALTLNGP